MSPGLCTLLCLFHLKIKVCLCIFSAVYINIFLIVLFADGRKPGRVSVSGVGFKVVRQATSFQNDSGKWSSSSALLEGPARISCRFLPLISSRGSFLNDSHPLYRPIVSSCFLLMLVGRTDNSYTFKEVFEFHRQCSGILSARIYTRANSLSHTLPFSLSLFPSLPLTHTNTHTCSRKLLQMS